MSCRHYESILNENNRYYINSKEHNNCVLCLINDKGAMTQETVAFYFGVTKMRICQVESEACRKLNKRMKLLENA
jgi:DNA-directed RNA polymerase sigma subunit (sigma70/sigma32)